MTNMDVFFMFYYSIICLVAIIVVFNYWYKNIYRGWFLKRLMELKKLKEDENSN
jgi:hypothetical protein